MKVVITKIQEEIILTLNEMIILAEQVCPGNKEAPAKFEIKQRILDRLTDIITKGYTCEPKNKKFKKEVEILWADLNRVIQNRKWLYGDL